MSSPSSLAQPISENLTQDNFLLWKAQVVLIVRGAQLFGYLDSTIVTSVKTGRYPCYMGRSRPASSGIHQCISVMRGVGARCYMHHCCCSLERDQCNVCISVSTCTTAVAVWKEINAMFASQSRARTIQLRTCLATTWKGDSTASAYYCRMKGFADEMIATGEPLEDEDFISYVLAGLDHDYNSFVENITGKDELSLGTLYSQSQSSVNAAACGRGGYRGQGGRGGGRGGFGCGFNGLGETGGTSSGTKPVCQLCKKTGHTVQWCWKLFDRNYTRGERVANNAEGNGYNVDTTWYSDTGETNHVTSELEKLTTRDKVHRA
jgi:hypothetical protein